MIRSPLQSIQNEQCPLPSASGQQEQPTEMLDAMVGGESALIPSRKLSLLGRKWKYRGEGNANLVIALQQREIMRLHKAERRPPVATPCDAIQEREKQRELTELAEHAEREHVCREVLFCHRVMVPLVGSCYLQPPVAARLDSSEVREINFALQSQRPVHRHHKEVLCAGGYVTLYPDYALLPANLADPDPMVPTFCVEVKPKQGWIPQPNRVLPKCTFCMKQFLKLKNNSISRRSNYCPLDLFSGEPHRMQTALQALLATPQNNLKIFKNGVLVYGDGVGNFDSLFEVLQSWFGTPLNQLDNIGLLNSFCSIVLEALTRDLSEGTLIPITATASVSRFCQEDIQASEYANELCKNDLQNLFNSAAPLLQPACDSSWQVLPTNCVLDRILSMQMLEQCHKVNEILNSSHSRKDYGYVGAVICDSGAFKSPLHRYLLATTAKDCSILLAFQPITKERAQTLPLCHISRQAGTGELFVFNVGVSDLDPKPVSCIEKHRQRDREMLMACIELKSRQREVSGSLTAVSS